MSVFLSLEIMMIYLRSYLAYINFYISHTWKKVNYGLNYDIFLDHAKAIHTLGAVFVSDINFKKLKKNDGNIST